MNFTNEELEVINATNYIPSVSLILNNEPKIALKTEMKHKLKLAEDRVKKQLAENYPGEMESVVLHKLDSIINGIDFDAIGKSIAIYVSPVLAKVFYLNVLVEEKIIIDESFEIRDLVYARQEHLKYLILLLSGKQVKAFICENEQITSLPLGVANSIDAYENDMPERVLNFSDPSEKKEILQDRFLKHIDTALSAILKHEPIPYYLIGTDRLTGHFKSISANTNHIIEVIPGNYENASLAEIKQLLKPHADAWQQRKNNEILQEIETAFSANKLEVGVKAVWKAATEKSGKTLIVGKNYTYKADHTGSDLYISKHEVSTPSVFYIKDAVDEIIQQVIQYGGTVHFVDDGLLDEYLNIVLIRYY